MSGLELPASAAQQLAAFVLLCARLAPLAWLVPWAAVRRAPPALALGLTLLLALCLWPAISLPAAPLPLSPVALLLLALREALIGLVYAVALSLPLRALEWGGWLSGRFIAESGAPALLGALQLALAVVAFFALGGPRVAIGALAASLARRPLGAFTTPADPAALALGSVRLVAEAYALALLLALPVGAALALAELALALAARAGLGAAVSAAAAPARAALALLVVWISTMLLLQTLPQNFERGLLAAERLLRAL